MCGFNAIFAYSSDAPPVDPASLERVRDAMAARGPDGQGAWIASDGRVGFGHRRLAIIDISDSGAQPMAIDGGRLAITYNGEIYNYKALRDELIAAGVAFHGTSDTEVILRLYDRDGLDMLGRLRGMFAFALWDRDNKGLLLARDGFGIKPLYLADDGKTVRAASQVKALLAGGGIDDRPDPAGHAGFFMLGSVPEPHTLYRGIRALGAGTALWIDADGGRRQLRFFNPAEGLRAEQRQPLDLAAALNDTVAHHLIADVPVGLFLSAGLDSATLVGLAAGAAAKGLDTVTLAFDEFADTPKDEAPLAELVARHYGTRHHTVRVRGADFAAERERLMAAMDQPTIDGVNVYFVAKAAAETGLKVALSGLGGDELFAGYDTFRKVPQLARRLGPAGPLVRPMGRAFRSLVAPWIGRVGPPKAAGLLEFGTTFGDAWLLRRGLFMPWELPDLMDRDMARDGLAALSLRRRLDETQAGLTSDRARITALEAGWYMKNQLLRDADWAGMAHSLEIRVPFVDTHLFAQVAPGLSGPDAPTKMDMAMTPQPGLPEALLGRPKTGFFVPVRDWLLGGRTPESNGRGLRGWARAVYADFTGA